MEFLGRVTGRLEQCATIDTVSIVAHCSKGLVTLPRNSIPCDEWFYCWLFSGTPCRYVWGRWHQNWAHTSTQHLFMSMHGNWQKNDFLGKMIRSLKLSKRIFLGASTHGILTHSGFRKYIWFGWPNLRFEVMTCISVKHIYMKWEIQCKKLKQLKVRSYAKNQIKLESIFYSFQSNQTRNEKVLFLTASNSALNTRYPPLPYIFWTLWTWGFTRYHLTYTIPT